MSEEERLAACRERKSCATTATEGSEGDAQHSEVKRYSRNRRTDAKAVFCQWLCRWMLRM